jgi:hypothetical protein
MNYNTVFEIMLLQLATRLARIWDRVNPTAILICDIKRAGNTLVQCTAHVMSEWDTASQKLVQHTLKKPVLPTHPIGRRLRFV